MKQDFSGRCWHGICEHPEIVHWGTWEHRCSYCELVQACLEAHAATFPFCSECGYEGPAFELVGPVPRFFCDYCCREREDER